MKKLLVCGGRDFTDEGALTEALDIALERLGGEIIVIHGAAKGADLMAEAWAKKRQLNYMGFPAKWDKHKKAAAPLRNAEMLAATKPDAAVAFKGKTGTPDMVRKLRKAGVPVWTPGWDCA